MSKETRETLVFANTIPSGEFQVLSWAVHSLLFPSNQNNPPSDWKSIIDIPCSWPTAGKH